ncbi:hypothetical protein DXG01_015843 [Tephrocybe rancida]|nr:hypothetical protein DXG01_015843 [Tephrocybe rancida]
MSTASSFHSISAAADRALAVQFRLGDCMFDFLPASKHCQCEDDSTRVSLVASHPHLGRIGSLNFVKTTRRNPTLTGESCCPDNLWGFKDTLFDDEGRLCLRVPEPDDWCGTGAWGDELNEGEIIWIDDLEVLEQFRERGVGTSMLTELMASEYVTVADHLMCDPRPRYIPRISYECFSAWQDRLLTFFRTNGFRRVGRTPYLGYSPNPFHPSHLIAADDDADQYEDYVQCLEVVG